MANGPFSVNPQSVRRIGAAQVTEGSSFANTEEQDEQRVIQAKRRTESAALSVKSAELGAESSSLQMVSAVANLATQTVNIGSQIAETMATNQLEGDLQSLTDQLSQSDTPSVDDSLLGNEAHQDPDFRSAVNEMRRIKAAEKGGRLNREFVIERYNEIIATNKARNPLFAEELEKAGRDFLGFSPMQETIKQMLATTPEEEAYRDLSVRAARLGISPEDLQTVELESVKLQLDKDRYSLLKQKGNYDANTLGSEVRTSTAQTYVKVSAFIGEQVAAGGITEPEQLKAFIQQQFGAQRASMLANMPSSVDASIVNAHITTLNNEEARLLGMADTGSLVNMVTNQNELLVATAESDILKTPVIGKIYASLGKEAAAEVMGQISRFRTNPGALQAVFAAGGEGSSALSLGLVLEQSEGALDVISGIRAAKDDNEARVAAWFATKELQTGNTIGPDGKPVKVDGTEAVRLVDVLKASGQDVTVTAFNDPRVVRTISSTKETHGQLINLVDSYKSTLAQEYAQLQSQGDVPLGTLEVQGGIIIDSGQTQTAVSQGQTPRFVGVGSGGLIGTGTGATGSAASGSAAYQKWVTKANRLIKLSETYKGVGVLPETKYSDAATLLNTLTTGIEKTGEVVPAPKVVTKWGLDANGVPVPITD